MPGGVSLGSAHGQIILDAGPAQRGAETASKAVLAMQGVVAGASAAITASMIRAGADIARAMTGFVTSGVTMAADLEKQMSGIQSIMGATADEIESLEELILDLGVDPNLMVSTIEAAEAIEMLGRNGLNTQQILDGAAKSTVLLANATGAQFATAADIATDVMALWNIEAKDMIEAVDGITSVVTNSKFTINDYAAAVASGGGVASQVGIDFADFNAAIVAVAASFGGGSDAGTSFKTMLMRLAAPTDQSLRAMQELGLATEDGSIAFYDANGNIREMAEIAGLLNGALGDLSDQQRAAALSTIFGAYGMRFAAQMANYTEEEFRELQATMADTSAVEAAAIRMDNFRGAMEVLDGVIETIKIQLGQALLPLLTDIARAITNFLEENADRFIGFFEDAVEALDRFIRTAADSGPLTALMDLLSRLGVPQSVLNSLETGGKAIETLFDFILSHGKEVEDLLLGVGTAFASFLVLNKIAGIITTVVTAVGKLGAVVSAAGGVLAAIVSFLGGPLTVALGLIALLIGGLAVAWKNNWFDIQGRTEEAVSFIRGLIDNFLGRVQAFWDEHGEELTSRVNNIWLRIQEIIGGVVFWIQSRIQMFVERVQAFWEAHGSTILTTATGVWETIKEYLGGVWDQIMLGLDAFTALLEGDWEAFGEKLLELWKRSWQIVIDFLAGLWESVQPLLVELAVAFVDWFRSQDWEQHGRTIIDGIKSALSTFWSAVSEVVGVWWTAFQDWFTSQDWEAHGQTILEGIRTALSTFWGTVSETVGGWYSSFAEWFESQDWEAHGQTVLDGIKSALGTFWATVSETVGGWYASFSTWFESQDWEGQGQTVLDGIKSAFGSFWGTVSETVMGWRNAMQEWFDNTDWQSIGQVVVTAILEALASFGERVGEKLNAWYTAVEEWVNSVDWYTIGFTIVTLLLEGLASFWGTVIGTVAGWYTSFFTWFSEQDWGALAVIAVAMIVGGLVTFWEVASETVAGWYTGFIDWATTQDWGAIAQSVVDGVANYLSSSTAVLDAMMSMASGAWDAFVGFITSKVSEVDVPDFTAIIRGRVEEVRGIINQWIEGLRTRISDGWESILSAAREKWESIKQAIRSVLESLFSAMGLDLDEFIADWQQIWEDVRFIAAEVWERIKGAIANKVDEVKSSITTKLSEAKDQAAEIWEAISGTASEIWEAISGVIGEKVEEVRSVIAGKIEEARGVFETVLGVILGVASEIWGAISGVVGEKVEEVRSTVETKTNETLSVWSTIWDAISSAVGEVLDSILSSVGEKLEEVRSTVADKMGEARDAAAEFVGEFVQIGADLVGGLISGILSKVGDLISTVTNMVKRAVRSAREGLEESSPSRVFMDIGRNVVLGFIMGIDQMEGELEDRMEALFDFGDVLSRIGSIAAKRFEDSVLDPMQEQMEVMDASLRRRREFVAEQMSLTPEDLQDRNLLDQLRQRGLSEGDEALVRGIDALIELETELAELDEKYAAKRQENLEKQQQVTKDLAALEQERIDIQAAFDKAQGDIFRKQQEAASALQSLEEDRAKRAAEFAHNLDLAFISLADMLELEDTSLLQDAIFLQEKYDEALAEGNKAVADQIFKIWKLQEARTEAEEDFAEKREEILLKQQKFEEDLRQLEKDREEREKKIAERREKLMRTQLDLEKSMSMLAEQRADEERKLQEDLIFARKNLSDSLAIDPRELENDQRLAREYFRAVAEGNDEVIKQIEWIWELQAERNALEKEYAEEQERILRLQQAQADMAFLRQQLDLLDLIAEHGLDAADILGGMTLGLDASIEDVLDAMTSALEAIIEQTEEELEIASPSKVFERIGGQIMAGMAAGITDMMPVTQATMDSLLSDLIAAPATVSHSNVINNNTTYQLQSNYANVETESDLRHTVRMLQLTRGSR